MRFEYDEIGQDQDAVILLAKKEASKLGANRIYWVSGTSYKDTDQIASSTYRCIRAGNWVLIDSHWRPKQYTENKFEVQKDGKVIYDKATGLMWQQSGSEKDITYDEARNYISQLNKERFAGYNDWRLPTLEEAITLLKPTKTNNGMFIDPLFEDKINWIWTSGLFSASSAWVVVFGYGGCGYSFDFNYDSSVRAVR